MRKSLTFLFFIFLVSAFTASAQLTQRHNAIRIGDRIIKQQLPYVSPGESGEGQLWDFSRLPESSREYTVEYLEPGLFNDSLYIMGRDTFLKEQIRPGELIIGMEYYTAYYYRQTDSALFQLGYENPLTLVHYEEPLLQMRYPLDTLHRIGSDYRTETTYSSEKKYGTQGAVQIFPDATGRLILPSGDTLSGVTRIKTLQTCLSDGQDSVSLPPVAMESYKWYASGYRYPVFETLRMLHPDTLQTGDVFKTSFFYPPVEHAYLEDDISNLSILDEQLREQEAMGPKPEKNGQKDGRLSGTGWGCSFYPNPVEHYLNLKYWMEKDVEVSCLIYDTAGRLLRRISGQQLSGQYTEQIDFSGMATGSYVLRFICGDEQKSGIIIKK